MELYFSVARKIRNFNMEIPMQINPETLKKLRNKRGFSQQTLADASGVAKKTIARMESGKGEPRGETVKLIAKALRVEADVLSKEPDSDEVRGAELQQNAARRVPAHLDAGTVLAYDLVCERYGVEWRLILEGAPIFFTLLAEMSLADRRRRVGDMKAIIPEHLFLKSQEDPVVIEEDSIARRDVFAALITGGGWPNPFCDFVSRKAKELDPDGDMLAHEDLRWGFEEVGFIDHSSDVFEKYLKSFTGDSARAGHALSRGYVRIGQIPMEFRGDDGAVIPERVKWLEEKVPDEDWEEYERLLERFSSESPVEGVLENA